MRWLDIRTGRTRETCSSLFYFLCWEGLIGFFKGAFGYKKKKKNIFVLHCFIDVATRRMLPIPPGVTSAECRETQQTRLDNVDIDVLHFAVCYLFVFLKLLSGFIAESLVVFSSKVWKI